MLGNWTEVVAMAAAFGVTVLATSAGVPGAVLLLTAGHGYFRNQS